MVKVKQKYHPVESCYYYSSRNMLCPYCNGGSKPVAKSLIVDIVEGRIIE